MESCVVTTQRDRERGGQHPFQVERGVDAAENVRRLASIPLVSQPGSAYSYGQDTPLCSAARPRGVSSVSSRLPLWAGHGRARPRARGRLRAAARSASGGEGAPPARHERHGLPPLAGRRGQAPTRIRRASSRRRSREERSNFKALLFNEFVKSQSQRYGS